MDVKAIYLKWYWYDYWLELPKLNIMLFKINILGPIENI